MITTVTSVQRFATKTLYTRARATGGSTMLAPMSPGAGKGLTPSPTRDPAVGAVQAVGALRGPLRLPPGVPGTDFWLPGTV